MKRTFISLLLLFVIGSAGNAKIILPQFFGDNMVLQQSTFVRIWGKAKINANVTIKCSWSQKIITTKSDKDGRWSTRIATPKASFALQNMLLSDGENLRLSNILIGEVWLCTGQSNMEMPLRGFTNCPIAGNADIVANAAQYKDKIHCVTIRKSRAIVPLDTCEGKWKECTPENAANFTATGFNFAVALQKVLNVPIGIFCCSYGGSKVEGWLPERILKNYPDVDLKNMVTKQPSLLPMVMYNAMLHPIEGYTIKGVIWYQGESNVGQHKTYGNRLATMVNTWRSEWGQDDFPFYIVEIAPYQYGDEISGGYLRETEYKASKTISNSGFVCTNDLVEPFEKNQIHPRNKQKLGKRLSRLILQKTYSIAGINAESPAYKSMEIQDNKIILSFDNAENGFNGFDGFEGFEIASADKIFHKANAKIFHNIKIEVSSSDVPAPVAVRYCFRSFQIGNVKNTWEMPLVPFRTDDWEQ